MSRSLCEKVSTRYRCRFLLILICLTCALTFYYWSCSNLSCVSTRVEDVDLRSFPEVDPCPDLGPLQADDPKLVTCLTKHYLAPPSKEPYAQLNPKVENPTQFGQNIIVLKLLQFKKNGFFLECGAMDGEIYSNTLFLERQFGWTGLLIEADSNNYRMMMQKHRKAWTSKSCLSPKTTSEKLTLVGIEFSPNTGGLTLGKFTEKLQKEFAGLASSKRASVQVQCFPLYTYFLALNITEVDYFSLDIEGADFEILKTIPFDKIIFKVLEVEVHWVKEGKEAVKTFLESHGYIFMKEVSVDYIFIHNSLKLPSNFVL